MTKIALLILDGFGLRKSNDYNAVNNANMPYFRSLMKTYSHTKLKTKGNFVGLTKGQFGNSEVGHLNLGSGRVVKQDSMKIAESIDSGDFYKNKMLTNLITQLKKNNSYLHLMGLCSSGGVHSNIKHLYAILTLCKKLDFYNVLIHFISDGRDTNVESGLGFYRELERQIKKIGVGKIVSISGRFYAMDREKNYDRTREYFNVLNNYEAENKFDNLKDAFNYFYSQNITDEYLKPSILKNGNYKVNKQDAILCFNFRSDRARQIFEVLIENKFKNLYSFIEYDKKFEKFVNVVFKEESNKNCLGEVLSNNNKTQLRISETTKYAHVTYFFNLLIEQPFKNEKRIIIDSDVVDNFAKKPKMKAKEITDTVISETDKTLYDFILVNFPNADMVGHTGNYEATIKSLEFLDKCLNKIVENLKQKGYIVLITADHGNADIMRNKDGSPCTTHTTSDAPFIIVDNKKYKLNNGGKLANVSPTILDLFKIKCPKEFTEKSLINDIDKL